MTPGPSSGPRPRLTQAHTAWTTPCQVLDAQGQWQSLLLPTEQPLTLYVDRAEWVTLMTLGQDPEHLVLGWLRQQRRGLSLADIESVTVDWTVQAAAVRTRLTRPLDRSTWTGRPTVTSGCGQGTVFGDWLDGLSPLPRGPGVRPPALARIAQTMRTHDSVYKQAGSVHACALFTTEGDLLHHVEDVGRHNALDTLAGRLWMQPEGGWDPAACVLYTTGRLTSEMVIKSVQMGLPVVVSRSGSTQMGVDLAQTHGLTLIGRCLHDRFLVFSGESRLGGSGLPCRSL